MLKKYTSKTQISINVVLKSGCSRHVSFTPRTGGGSVFYTDDKDLQEAMARHVKFGKLFRVETVAQQDTAAKTRPGKTGTSSPEPLQPSAHDGAEETAGETLQAEDPGEETKGTRQISVTDIDDAKDYLSEHFGVSRTKMRSEKQIRAAAEQNGIEFVGI